MFEEKDKKMEKWKKSEGVDDQQIWMEVDQTYMSKEEMKKLNSGRKKTAKE